MSTGFKGPIVGAPRSTADGYKYRTGMGMMLLDGFEALRAGEPVSNRVV